MALLSSPRRRRRLLWAVGLVVAIGGFLVLNAVLPSHGGPVRASPNPNSRTPPLSSDDVAEQAAARRSAAVVQPLANRFVDELVQHRNLDDAYQTLSPRTRDHYSLLDWQAGRDLPLRGASGAGGPSVAFAGRTTVGFVAGLSPGILFALRFDKLPVLGWRVAYMHQGHSSTYVTESNYSPAGFVPGSRGETLGTWLILLGGLAGLIAVVALIDRRLSR